MKNLNKLIEIEHYLEQNKGEGIAAFKQLIAKANQKSVEYVVLSFTYENVEAYLKIDGKFELGDDLFGVISQSELDELSRYDYDDNNPFEDCEYWKFQEIVWTLIEVWIMNCFEAASKEVEIKEIKYYFKQNHDSLEILELNHCGRKLEQSEFEVYVKNNEINVMKLLG